MDLPGLSDPITELTLDLPSGIGLQDFAVVGLPSGWRFAFLDGFVPAGGLSDDGERSSPSLLSFLADSSTFGVGPGETLFFSITSSFSPTRTRAFTNSPGFDSDEAAVFAPTVPEPATSLLVITALAGLLGFSGRNRNSGSLR